MKGRLESFLASQYGLLDFSRLKQRARVYGHALGEVAAETLWPTRCIICDTPGTNLCARCRKKLPYLDQWSACPRCGDPFGHLQCLSCNSFTLREMGRTKLPYAQCRSAVIHQDNARKLITEYKDAGELALADVLAGIMADALPPSWLANDPFFTYIPASKKALRQRGYDHMELLAKALSKQTSIPQVSLFQRPRSQDQRTLSREQRYRNMQGIIKLKSASAAVPRSIIVLDDVYTTGATMLAACDELERAGIPHINALTFARVPR